MFSISNSNNQFNQIWFEIFSAACKPLQMELRVTISSFQLKSVDVLVSGREEKSQKEQVVPFRKEHYCLARTIPSSKATQ